MIAEFAKKLNGKFEIKGGFMDGKVVSLETVNALAAIPALPVLQAQVLGTMLAPISALACVLKQIAEKQALPLRKPLPSNETFRLDPYLKNILQLGGLSKCPRKLLL